MPPPPFGPPSAADQAEATRAAQSGLTGRRLRRSLVVVALSGLAATGLTVSALYTDAATVPANTFTIGTVDIASAPTSAVLTASSVTPGGVTTAPLQVLNSGTLALRYAIRSTTTENALASQLDLTIKSGVSSCNNAGFGATGTVLYGPAAFGSTGGLDLVGSQTQGAHAGDRSLAPATNETLCFQLSLPWGASSSAQSTTTTATLTLVAEQTANN